MPKTITPGGVDEYISACPAEIKPKLEQIRKAIKEVLPSAIETTSYFGFPGYSCGAERYYSGMFVWFSYKAPFIRLHLVPPVIEDHKSELENYKKTESVVSFPQDQEIPIALIKKLTKASLKIMMAKA